MLPRQLKYLFCFLFVCIIKQYSFAQPGNMVDSLKKVLPSLKNDTTKLNALLDISNLCAEDEIETYASQAYDLTLTLESRYKDNKSVLHNLLDKKGTALNNLGYVYSSKKQNEKALSAYKKAEQIYLSDSIYQKQLGYVYNNMGMVYQNLDNDPEALNFYNKSIIIRLRINDVEGISQTYSNMANTYINMGDFNKALQLHYKELSYNDKYNLTRSKGYSYIGIGFILDRQGNSAEALINYKMAAECLKKGNDMQGLISDYNYIGAIFEAQLDYPKALSYYDSSYQIAVKLEDISSMSAADINKGNIYRKQGKVKEASEKFLNAIEIYKDAQNYSGLSIAQDNLAELYMDLKKYKDAENQAQEAKKNALKTQRPTNIKGAAFTLFQIQQKTGNYKEALENYLLFTKMRDSLSNIETQKSSVKLQMKYEFDKKEAASKVEQEKREIEHAAQENKQRITILFVSIGLLLVLIFTGFIFNRFKITQKQNKIIESQKIEVDQKNEVLNQQNEEIVAQRDEIKHQKQLVEEHQREIIDSITYAKRIQDAILPPTELIREKLPDSFVLYKPKDIVAGDFYWMEEINDTLLIAAADCTGHGVPGAMVSVVCSNALNRAVKEFHLTDTGKILDKVRELVIETFMRSNQDVKDGMDISILSINRKNQQIKWSGANNPLWYFDNKDLVEIKANKQPIGKSDSYFPFTTHTIEYKPNTTFYLFTDGYADQFGGSKGKKFKYKQFQDTIAAILEEDPNAQRTALNTAFECWKGNLEQVDDVCVIGIKI